MCFSPIAIVLGGGGGGGVKVDDYDDDDDRLFGRYERDHVGA